MLTREGHNLPVLSAEAQPEHPLAGQLRRQRLAHEAWLRASASVRLRRAALARPRAQRLFEVGDLVYFWRAQ
eukprot:10051869-Lingulodinium_polyedra.AAC.1